MRSGIKYILMVVAFLFCATQLQAADYGTFESFYSSGGIGFWGWTFIIVGTIAVAAFAFFTFGGGASAAPAWMAAVGSWIGSTVGLSGAAAANFGLALLGGGSVAAGGLGVAGGVAVLTAAMTFGVDVAISYGSDIAIEKWSHSKFIEANKDMLTLPVPRNEKGGKAYRTAISYLQEYFKQDKSLSDPENQHVLKRAAEILYEKMQSEDDKDYILKDKTLLALLYFQRNRYSEASNVAREAMSLADSIEEKRTFPSFIWALAEIANPDKDCTEDVIQAMRVAYYHEPDSKLIPIMTGCAMDRLMYRYHYGKLSIDHLSYFCGIITNTQIDEELAAASLEIFITRCLIELKRTKQDIYIVTKDKSMMGDRDVVNELRKRFNRHKALISLLQKEALPQVYRLAEEFPKESKVKSDELVSLLDSYYKDLAEMDRQIKYVPYDLSVEEPDSIEKGDSSSNYTWWWIIAGVFLFGIAVLCLKKRKA